MASKANSAATYPSTVLERGKSGLGGQCGVLGVLAEEPGQRGGEESDEQEVEADADSPAAERAQRPPDCVPGQ